MVQDKVITSPTNAGVTLYDELKPLRTMSIERLMEPPVTVVSETPASKIMGLMIERKMYDVFLPLGTKITSINIRDLLSIRDITATRPSKLGRIAPSLSPGSNVGYAAGIMSLYRLRALPVKENDKLIGQITIKRIVTSIHEMSIDNTMPRQVSASRIMTPHPVVLGKKAKVSTARSIMIRHRIDHLPIVDEYQRRLGIVTSSQIMEAMLPSEKIGRKILGVEKRNRLDWPVMGIVEKNVVTSKPDDPLKAILSAMIDEDSTYTLVCVGDKIQGIVTYRDIVNLLAEKLEQDLPAYIVGLPDDPFGAALARSRFAEIVRFLQRIAPEVEEARCKIKLHNTVGGRRRYEVDVSVITPYRKHVYSNAGWDLAKIFDRMRASFKNGIGRRPTRRRRDSIRKKALDG